MVQVPQGSVLSLVQYFWYWFALWNRRKTSSLKMAQLRRSWKYNGNHNWIQKVLQQLKRGYHSTGAINKIAHIASNGELCRVGAVTGEEPALQSMIWNDRSHSLFFKARWIIFLVGLISAGELHPVLES